jgi:FkbM family methyltransferase
MAFDNVIRVFARLAESHPYAWKLAWEALHRLPFLLPHDKSYNALRHFIAAAPEGLFLDIGANDGISALSFRKFNSTYRILSLEPNHTLEPALRKIQSRDPLFDYRMIAAGSEPANLQFFTPTYHGVVLHTFTSSEREQVRQALAECFGARIANASTIEAVTSEVIPLDDLALEPAIIKIDAEGFDYEVLMGLRKTIGRARPFMVVEIAWATIDRVVEFFRVLDYRILSYDIAADRFSTRLNQPRTEESGQRNLFAVPLEKLGFLPVDGR